MMDIRASFTVRSEQSAWDRYKAYCLGRRRGNRAYPIFHGDVESGLLFDVWQTTRDARFALRGK